MGVARISYLAPDEVDDVEARKWLEDAISEGRTAPENLGVSGRHRSRNNPGQHQADKNLRQQRCRHHRQRQLRVEGRGVRKD